MFSPSYAGGDGYVGEPLLTPSELKSPLYAVVSSGLLMYPYSLCIRPIGRFSMRVWVLDCRLRVSILHIPDPRGLGKQVVGFPHC